MDITKFKYSTFLALNKYTKALTTALGYRDLMTSMHSERVHGLSMEIGMQCNLDDNQLGALEIGSAFHDVGKIGIPDSILMKPGKLDKDEWDTMTTHCEMGQKILLATELEGSKRAGAIIRHHHESFNGNGYPDKLSGEDIPICSRIISIADSYDAMAVTRSYHKARSHPEIMKILHEETGQKHDPYLMKIFVKLIENSPLKTQMA